MQCAKCPDQTKALRRCPKPKRDPDAWATMPGDPDCPVLNVPGWFWDAVTLGATADKGGLSASDIDAAAWTEGEIAWCALSEARATEAEIERKKRAMRKPRGT